VSNLPLSPSKLGGSGWGQPLPFWNEDYGRVILAGFSGYLMHDIDTICHWNEYASRKPSISDVAFKQLEDKLVHELSKEIHERKRGQKALEE
jgi:hypothetical protein